MSENINKKPAEHSQAHTTIYISTNTSWHALKLRDVYSNNDIYNVQGCKIFSIARVNMPLAKDDHKQHLVSDYAFNVRLFVLVRKF